MQPDTQTSTNAGPDNSVTAPATVQTPNGEVLLTAQQDYYVSYLALGGLLPTEDGPGKKYTAGEFAQSIGVARETLYYWRKHIPELWQKVSARRAELGGKDRLAQVWNAVYMSSLKGNPEAQKLYLANFDPGFRMPTEKHEVDAGGGFMDLLQRARQENARTPRPQFIDAQEAETVANDTDQKQPTNITAGS